MTKCKHFQNGECRSCSLLELSYEDGLSKKVSRLKELFPKIKINSFVTPTRLYQSRNKAKIAVGGSVEAPLLGISDSKGNVTEVLDCFLYLDEMNEVLSFLKEKITEFKLTPYNIHTRKGELKYILLYRSESTKEMMLRFVVRSKESLDRIRLLYENELSTRFPSLKVVTVNLQPEPKAIFEGEEEIYLSSEQMVKNIIDGNAVFLGTRSFFQVTSQVAERLYTEAAHQLRIRNSKRVMDLFCGVGAFGITCSNAVEEVIGIELSKEAIRSAKLSKEENGITNIQFVAEDAFKYISNNKDHFDCVIVNPPRRGLGKKITDTLIKMGPELILYSSCNPESQKNDIEELSKSYTLKEITPYDMFPLTEHMECLAVLERI